MEITAISRRNGRARDVSKEKKKGEKLGEARHIGEGQSISDEEGKQWRDALSWVRKGMSYTPGNVSHC